jgi:hypothetical protein
VVEDGDWEEVRVAVAVAVAVKNRLDMDEVRCVNVVWSRYMVYPSRVVNLKWSSTEVVR